MRATRKERIRKVVKKFPFAACAFGLVNDINLNLVFRSLCNFGGIEFFVVGSDSWFRGATNGLEELVKVTHFKDCHAFLEHMKETDYELVAIEQSDNSVSLQDFNHTKKPCFIFGNETTGLKDDCLLSADAILEIPMEGYHPCLNVGVSSGIVFYDFCYGKKMND